MQMQIEATSNFSEGTAAGNETFSQRDQDMTASLIIWMTTMTIAVSSVVLTAAARHSDAHAYVTGIVTVAIALLAIYEHRKLVADKANEKLIAASTARHMGLVWTWGAICLLVTYVPAFGILQWKEWMPFTMVFGGVAALCLYFNLTLKREIENGNGDSTLLNLSHYLAYAQLFGMAAVMTGLVLDGKFPAEVKRNLAWQDWAANNVFFFGAFALFAITANSLIAERERRERRSEATS